MDRTGIIFHGNASKPECVQCGKDAIGVQSFGCRASFVCWDHAHDILRALGPGRHYSTGECSFRRFGAGGTGPYEGSPRLKDCG